MGFSGPGVYAIVPYQAPGLSMNSWGGHKEAGAVVRTYDRGDRDRPTPNTLWQVAQVAGSGDNAEYLIINVLTGYFLTATGDKTITSTPQISPSDASCRWFIKSSRTNGYDVFVINNKLNGRGQLNVRGSATQSGTDIISYPIENTDNTKWYFDPFTG
ncbi:hypothetical protein JX265_005232 [Neoarthrinium moseri]|uniref:Ricin B lectin domain-containing protein n=1 Tax=Neoarthrinium moseri TaxID=1658444 RepID=A0A9Q0AQX6_9PEZI|nr:uncharacterized protein JN550_007681 [Neoarthrinium moseri]KAI1845370.1 hypothetical protein JX266_008465 [Neoarthrinium moseri]KAI1866293.1 hypothetical protein JN550_007681 [Neoarthrinium moseri]KAI1873610.1 hypothetical protein JX265_005232 [Neoarthrinium moseri]